MAPDFRKVHTSAAKPKHASQKIERAIRQPPLISSTHRVKTTSLSRLSITLGISIAGMLAAQASSLNLTVNAGSTYSTQQNNVTTASVNVNGAWLVASDKRAVANTKDTTSSYGSIVVQVGSYSKVGSVENGLIRGTDAADIFKFSEFSTAPAATPGQVIFTLTNAGKIEYNVVSLTEENYGRVLNSKAVTVSAIQIANFSGATISAAGDVFKLGGKLIFSNAGTITAATGQVLDMGDVQSALVSQITNSGTLSSAGNEAISGPANMTIYNSGLIQSTSADPSSAIKVKMEDDGVDLVTPASARLDLTNTSTGIIRGTKHGVTGDRASALTNSGLIEGLSGSGVNWDAVVGYETNPGTHYYTTSLSNNAGGTIRGATTDSVAGDGDGVDIDYGAYIVNAGTISANNSYASADGIAAGGGSIQNLSTGVITAQNAYNGGKTYGVLVDDSNEGNAFAAMSIQNAGLIEGTGTSGVGIRFISTYANTIVNSGVIRGEGGTAVMLGDGGDTLTVQNGAQILGDIVGGAGTDSFIVAVGAGNTFTFSDTLGGVENIEVTSGILSLGEGAQVNIGVDADGNVEDISGAGAVVFSGHVTLNIFGKNGLSLTSLEAGDTFNVLDVLGGVTGAENVSIAGDLADGLAWDTSRLGEGVISVIAIPEPAAALLGFAVFLLALRRMR